MSHGKSLVVRVFVLKCSFIFFSYQEENGRFVYLAHRMKVNQWLFGVYYVNNCQLCCTWRALHPAVAFSIQKYVFGVRNRGSSINVQYCHVLLSWCLVYRLIPYFTVCTLLLITAYKSVTQSIIIMNALTKSTKNKNKKHTYNYNQ